MTTSPPFTRLLLATEHTEFDSGAEALAFALAQHCALPLAAVLPMVSNAEFEAIAPTQAERADAEAAIKRKQLEAQAQAAGVRLHLQIRRGAEPHAEIVAEARTRAADLLVIRRRGRRGLLARLLVGEMVSQVVARSPCSVLVTPRGAHMWAQRVLVGIDPLVPDALLLEQAAGLAAACGLPLHLLCVVAPGRDAQAAGEQTLAAALARARRQGHQAEGELRVGKPHEQLLAAAAAQGADLIVLGRQGGVPAGSPGIGSTAKQVIGLAECPVLVHVHSANENPP